MSTSKAQSLNLYRKISISFFILTLILVVVIIYFSFSRVTIEIFSKKEELSVDFLVEVKQTSLKLTTGEVIFGQVLETAASGTENFASSGSKTMESDIAGVVSIINNYTKDQPLVATTRLLTPTGLLFRIKEGVRVPAGGQVDNVEVYVDDPDSITEAVPATKFTIPGLWEGLQSKIYAESYVAFTGDTQEVKIVSQDDIDRALDELETKLLEEALLDLTEQLAEGEQILSQATTTEIFSQEVDVQVGAQQDKFNATLELKVITVVFDEEKLFDLAQAKLINSLPDDKELVDLKADDFRYEVEKYDLADRSASLKVHLSGEMVLSLSSPILDKENLIGLTGDEVVEYLSNFEAIDSAEVKFSPFWATKTPRLKDHIKLKIKN